MSLKVVPVAVGSTKVTAEEQTGHDFLHAQIMEAMVDNPLEANNMIATFRNEALDYASKLLNGRKPTAQEE